MSEKGHEYIKKGETGLPSMLGLPPKELQMKLRSEKSEVPGKQSEVDLSVLKKLFSGETRKPGEMPFMHQELERRALKEARKIIQSSDLGEEKKVELLGDEQSVHKEKRGGKLAIFSESCLRANYLITSGFDKMQAYSYVMVNFLFDQLTGDIKDKWLEESLKRGGEFKVGKFEKWIDQLRPFLVMTESFTYHHPDEAFKMKRNNQTGEFQLDLGDYEEIFRGRRDNDSGGDAKTNLITQMNERSATASWLYLSKLIEQGSLGKIRNISSVLPNLPTLMLVGLVAEMNSEVHFEKDYSTELYLKAIKTITAISAAEVLPEDYDMVKAQKRTWFSRALVLARDTYMKYSHPWLFIAGNEKLAEITGIKDYGSRFYLLSHYPALHFIPELDKWYQEQMKDMFRRRDPEKFVLVQASFKGVWGMMESVLYQNMKEEGQKVKRLNQLAKEFLPKSDKQLIDEAKFSSRAGKMAAIADKLNTLIDLSKNQSEISYAVNQLTEDILNKMEQVGDLSRMRIMVSEGDWSDLMEVVNDLRPDEFELDVLFVSNNDDGRVSHEFLLSLDEVNKIVEGKDELSQNGEVAKKLLGLSSVRVGGKLKLIDLMSLWVKSRRKDADENGVMILNLRGKTDFFVEGAPEVPFEIQMFPKKHDGVNIAEAVIKARMPYKVLG
jgi:hypothetical protein